MTISYSVRVNGVIFNGQKAYTTYAFNHLPTRADVESKGDFASIKRIKVTQITTEHKLVKLAA